MGQLIRVRDVAPLDGLRLRLTLSDGSVVERDLSALASGPLFEPLRDLQFFQAVRVEGGSTAWPNGADICPDVLIWGGAPPAEPSSPPKFLRLTPETISHPG